jgi:hypothetical protein
MIEADSADLVRPDAPAPSAEGYSPQLRTALVLTGSGTAGAYHAGVLRALHEAGVKLDVVAGRGIGVVGALFAAVDGAQRLWDPKGFWRGTAVASFYRWRAAVTIAASAVALALALVVLPLAAIVLGLVVFPVDFMLRVAGIGGAAGLVGAYVRLAEAAFAADALPLWVPRLVVIVLGVAVVIVALSARSGPRGRRRGPLWWHAVRPPLSSAAVAARCWRVLWELLRGAAQLRQPAPLELARRYAELLADNIGQPGFRELLLTAHDLDARRDLVFALVSEPRRRGLVRRPSTEATEVRRAEIFDMGGLARDHLVDAVSGALSVALATEPHAITFAPDSYWRGETHRLCDRPGGLCRLVEELADLEVEQVIIASGADESSGPHTLAAARSDGRGRLGEYLQSVEAAAVRDAARAARGRLSRLFTIQPPHNPVGPFDFRGGYDDRSDRAQPLSELVTRGYEDAYHQFIEPVVGASGERVGRAVS